MSVQTLLRSPTVIHREWSIWARVAGSSLAIERLAALVSRPFHLGDFLIPRPADASYDIEAELEQVRSTPAEVVRADLDEQFSGALPDALLPLYHSPERELPELVEELGSYWITLLEPVLPRLAAIHAGDMNYRSTVLMNGGLNDLFNTLHPSLGYETDELCINKNYNCRHDLRGIGMILVPSVFAYPGAMFAPGNAQRAMVTYTAHGAGCLSMPRFDAPIALAELVGRTRAELLCLLELPVSTTALASTLGVTPSAVSQHLGVLKRAGLVISRRTGRAVLHERTSNAQHLLNGSVSPSSRTRT